MDNRDPWIQRAAPDTEAAKTKKPQRSSGDEAQEPFPATVLLQGDNGGYRAVKLVSLIQKNTEALHAYRQAHGIDLPADTDEYFLDETTRAAIDNYEEEITRKESHNAALLATARLEREGCRVMFDADENMYVPVTDMGQTS